MSNRRDLNRIHLKNILAEHKIEAGSTESVRFANFLLDPNNSEFFQSFLILCTGIMHENMFVPRLMDIL